MTDRRLTKYGPQPPGQTEVSHGLCLGLQIHGLAYHGLQAPEAMLMREGRITPQPSGDSTGPDGVVDVRA